MLSDSTRSKFKNTVRRGILILLNTKICPEYQLSAPELTLQLLGKDSLTYAIHDSDILRDGSTRPAMVRLDLSVQSKIAYLALLKAYQM